MTAPEVPGRCHGPGCTQTAVVEFWCSESCQDRWSRSLAAPEPMLLGISVSDAVRNIEALWPSIAAAARSVLGADEDVIRRHVAEQLDAVNDLYRPVGVIEAFNEDSPAFGRLPDAVEGDSTEHDCAPLPAGTSAEFPQVASENWVSRSFHWLFGRTT